MNDRAHDLNAAGATTDSVRLGDAATGTSLHHEEAQRAWGTVSRVMKVIMFTDIQSSVQLQESIGTVNYAPLLKRHDELFAQAMDTVGSGRIVKHTGDGFLAVFDLASEAVMAGLRFQWLLGQEKWPEKAELVARVGIHEGEILSMDSGSDGPGMLGAAVNLAARVMSLACGGQVLVTRSVFDASRQFVRGVPGVPEAECGLGWVAHGAYLVKGFESPVEIFEIGVRESAPFQKPVNGAEMVRSVSAEEEPTLGWRPAMAMEVPQRPGWELVSRLGEGGFGEVWLARHGQTREQRVFKFCFDALRLRSFKRELALFRLIRERLGVRRDIACLHEVQLESPPFFLESEYCGGGVLDAWLRARRKADKPVPLSARLELIAAVARALGAAHSLGIIHKDVKPSNIFMEEDGEGRVQPKLADFGIGVVMDKSVFKGLGVTFSEGFTLTVNPAQTGTRLYSAPEYMVGQPPSVQGDIYSLGVLLYQVVVDDYERPLGVGWQRAVHDPLLIEDIERCVDVEPERRFSSALELAERLEQIEERRATLKREIAEQKEHARQVEELALHKRRVRLAWMVSAGAVCVIGALSVILIQLFESNRAALRHAQEIEAERRQVITQTELGRERLYVADMLAVTEEVIRRRAEGARELVNGQRPLPDQRDLRGWEWFFADSLLNNGDMSAKVSNKPLQALELNAAGTETAVGGDSGEVSVWSTHSLIRLRSWASGGDAICSLAWSKAGLYAGLAGGEIVLLASDKFTPLTRWRAHVGKVTVLHLSKADGTLLSGGDDGALHWWREGKSIRSCQWTGSVSAVDSDDKGLQLAVVLANPGRLVLGAADHLQKMPEKLLNRPDSPLAWRPRSTDLALAMDDLPMTAWNPTDSVHEFSFEKDQSPGSASLAWSPDGAMAAVGGVDGKISLIDALRRIEPRLPAYGHRGPVTGLRWMHDRERLLSIGEDGTLRAWDNVRRSAQASSIETGGSPSDIVWHPQQDQLAMLISGDEVRLVEGRTWKTLWSQPMPQAAPDAAMHQGGDLAFSPDGTWLAAACAGRGWVAWNLKTGQRVSELAQTRVKAVEWADEGQTLILRDDQGWRVVSLTESAGKTTLGGKGQIAWAGGVGLGKLGIVSLEDGIWHVRALHSSKGDHLHDHSLPDGLGTPTCARAFGQENLLAIGFDSGLVCWMNVVTGKFSRPPLSHVGPVQALAWHRGGARLVSAGVDGSARIFNVHQAAQTWSIETMLPSDIVAADWSADGSRLIVAAGSMSRVPHFDASESLMREQKLKIENTENDRLTHALAALENSPEETFCWRELSLALEDLRSTDESAEVELLATAAKLGLQALTAPVESYEGDASAIIREWRGHPLPLPLRISQACVLEQWLEVAALTREKPPNTASAPWVLLRRAQAYEKLNRTFDAGRAGLEAWKAYQTVLALPEITFQPTLSREVPRAVNLKPWAMIRKTDEWTGGRGNTLNVLPDELLQAGDFSFDCRDFIQLAGSSLRLSSGQMLPRATGWIQLGGPAKHLALLLGACAIRESGSLAGYTPASLFLQRSNGAVTIVPLIYGQNIWDCWNPPAGQVDRAPDPLIAWLGITPYTRARSHGLAFFRFDWEAADKTDPITAFSIVSHMRAPAPMIMAAEVLPPTSPEGQ